VYRIFWADKAIALITILALAPLTPIVEAQTLPPPTEIPEEVLRTEIYIDARSPVDGKLLTAAEYIELSEQLESVNIPSRYLVSDKLQNLIQLLKLRKFIRQIVPFF
jgi:hypothetical protein